MASEALIGGLSVACALLFWWGHQARKELSGDCVAWSNVTESQLQLHQQMVLSLAERVHLDPAVREALRHQVRVLKSIGVASQDAIDVTPGAPSVAQLEAYGPRVEGPPLVRKVDLDEWNRGRSGFGLYEKDAEMGG